MTFIGTTRAVPRRARRFGRAKSAMLVVVTSLRNRSAKNHRERERRTPSRLACDRKRNAGPIFRHGVAARLQRSLAGDRVGPDAQVRNERIRLDADSEPQFPRTLPIRHAKSPLIRSRLARLNQFSTERRGAQ